MNASPSVSNPLNKKPRVATYDWDIPYQGFGTFNPFDDLTGRRWSMSRPVDFCSMDEGNAPAGNRGRMPDEIQSAGTLRPGLSLRRWGHPPLVCLRTA